MGLVGRLPYDFEAEFFYNWVGQDVFGYAFDLFFGFFFVQAVERQDEELTLPDVLYFGISQR